MQSLEIFVAIAMEIVAIEIAIEEPKSKKLTLLLLRFTCRVKYDKINGWSNYLKKIFAGFCMNLCEKYQKSWLMEHACHNPDPQGKPSLEFELKSVKTYGVMIHFFSHVSTKAREMRAYFFTSISYSL